MGKDERVVVDVDDARLGSEPLRHLVGVVRGGQPGADVEELPHAFLDGEEPDRAEQKVAADARLDAIAGIDGVDRGGGVAVDLVVVLTAQPVVPDPGGVRDRPIDSRPGLCHDAHTSARIFSSVDRLCSGGSTWVHNRCHMST